MLYLETNLLHIPDMVGKRRLIYYQNILKRNINEKEKNIVVAKQKNPCKGDWIELVMRNMKIYNNNKLK